MEHLRATQLQTFVACRVQRRMSVHLRPSCIRILLVRRLTKLPCSVRLPPGMLTTPPRFRTSWFSLLLLVHVSSMLLLGTVNSTSLCTSYRLKHTYVCTRRSHTPIARGPDCQDGVRPATSISSSTTTRQGNRPYIAGCDKSDTRAPRRGSRRT